MEIDNLIMCLKSRMIENTDIVSVSYHNGGKLCIDKNEIDKELPPFYRIELVLRPGTGSFIRAEIWLPDNWNERFIGTGNGGMAGGICYGALAQFVKQNYAVANTDMGTSRGRDSGINNPDVWKDFGWRSTHLMTQAAKLIIIEHYGRKEKYSYFLGSSTGGQQALMEAQRFPEDYNGIIAGVPANNRTFLHTYFLWNHRHLFQNGGQVLFTYEMITQITGYAAEFFQSRSDGAPGDCFVTNPAADLDTIEYFLQFLKLKLTLNDKQIYALRAIYTGPVNPVTGERIYNGLPIGAEMYGCGINDCQKEEDPNFYPFEWVFGKDYDWSSFDFDKDLDYLNEKLAEDLNANSADLSEFHNRGGKLFMYSGTADPCVPFPDAKKYYQRVAEKAGGFDIAKTFFRYFILPGKDHGDSGLGALGMRTVITDDVSTVDDNEFLALRLWVEENKPPEKLIAYGFHRETGKEFSRPVHPYPAQTKYAGGNVDSAESFMESNDPHPETPTCSEKYLN